MGTRWSGGRGHSVHDHLESPSGGIRCHHCPSLAPCVIIWDKAGHTRARKPVEGFGNLVHVFGNHSHVRLQLGNRSEIIASFLPRRQLLGSVILVRARYLRSPMQKSTCLSASNLPAGNDLLTYRCFVAVGSEVVRHSLTTDIGVVRAAGISSAPLPRPIH